MHSHFQISSVGSGCDTLGHSQSGPDATPLLLWLCAKGRCPVGKLGLNQNILELVIIKDTLLHSSFP